jgi:hypothetical protein
MNIDVHALQIAGSDLHHHPVAFCGIDQWCYAGFLQ